ncbi:conserved hypothetical protein [Talaromyces stipitatus ATCC 10500]|uniref:Histidine acid phosphatase n=1 Tax=Talaromyces stipitatus (strain ATCC 10500 / CBS 375.48 / QM 6759 / NRRL 1006) TaxID=441959 RepID=B8LTI2_TALSN|nr:uncharacterized protein TSTA_065180 [Talaromyces stipitatus ATCC 10500]EED23060.1 conserved hypothetical protein [Talaromyces stipitatus ATCC 10500]
MGDLCLTQTIRERDHIYWLSGVYLAKYSSSDSGMREKKRVKVVSVHDAGFPAYAQDAGITVWAVFGFNVHGDSTPAVLAQPRTLTPLGARSLYNVGANFRARYIMGGSVRAQNTWIQDLNQHSLDPEQVKVYSTSEQFTEASGLAFMQGLYPPTGNTNQSYTYLDDTYILSNGSIISSPLNDYQYPRIYASSLADPGSIFVAGHADCDKYQELEAEYQISAEFQKIESDNAQFYSDMYDVALEGVMTRASVGYARATDIHEYLEYNYLHNKSLADALLSHDLQRARVLANQYTYATNGNLTVSKKDDGNQVRGIAGRTLSRLILQSLLTNIETQGSSSKMTLVFGGAEPVVAFAGLSQLASTMNSQFYGMPVLGASMVLELFSMNPTSSDVYPKLSDLFVRFLFRNSSSIHEGFTEYPLFGYSPSQINLPFNEFAAVLRQFMLPSTKAWCEACNSSPMFCFGAANMGKKQSKNHLSLAGAGAIGAVVTLAVVAVAMGIARFCGVGLYRRRRSSGLGGFKGNRKMASDQDLSSATPSNGAFQKIVPGGGANVKSHERTGSWEMRNKDGAGDNVSQLDDERDEDISGIAEPVKCHQIV